MGHTTRPDNCGRTEGAGGQREEHPRRILASWSRPCGDWRPFVCAERTRRRAPPRARPGQVGSPHSNSFCVRASPVRSYSETAQRSRETWTGHSASVMIGSSGPARGLRAMVQRRRWAVPGPGTLRYSLRRRRRPTPLSTRPEPVRPIATSSRPSPTSEPRTTTAARAARRTRLPLEINLLLPGCSFVTSAPPVSYRQRRPRHPQARWRRAFAGRPSRPQRPALLMPVHL